MKEYGPDVCSMAKAKSFIPAKNMDSYKAKGISDKATGAKG